MSPSLLLTRGIHPLSSQSSGPLACDSTPIVWSLGDSRKGCVGEDWGRRLRLWPQGSQGPRWVSTHQCGFFRVSHAQDHRPLVTSLQVSSRNNLVPGNACGSEPWFVTGTLEGGREMRCGSSALPEPSRNQEIKSVQQVVGAARVWVLTYPAQVSAE